MTHSVEAAMGGWVTYLQKAFIRRFVFGTTNLANSVSKSKVKAAIDALGVLYPVLKQALMPVHSSRGAIYPGLLRCLSFFDRACESLVVRDEQKMVAPFFVSMPNE